MAKNILSLLGLDKAKPLPVGKPFDRSSYLGHGLILCSSFRARAFDAGRTTISAMPLLSFSIVRSDERWRQPGIFLTNHLPRGGLDLTASPVTSACRYVILYCRYRTVRTYNTYSQLALIIPRQSQQGRGIIKALGIIKFTGMILVTPKAVPRGDK